VRRRYLQVTAVAAALGAAACGGDSKNGTTATSAAASSGSGGASTTTTTSTSTSASSGTGGMMKPAADWSCIGKVMPPGKPMKATAVAKRVYKDFLNQKPIAGLTVKLCAKTDVDCKTPLDTKMTDANGAVTLMMPLGTDGFDGYEDVSGPGLAWLTFGPGLFVNDSDFEELILSKSQLNLMATLASQSYDATRASMALAVGDCAPFGKNSLAGVTFEVMPFDAKAKLAYVVGGLPDKNATETDASGFAGVLNVPLGAGTVTAKVKATGATIGTRSVFMRPDTCTSVFVQPMPMP
jgi:hypothetical protein